MVLRKVDDLRVTAELSAVWRADNKVPALPKFLEILSKEFTGRSRDGDPSPMTPPHHHEVTRLD